MVTCFLQHWLDNGPAIVRSQEVTWLTITDRRAARMDDSLSKGWGWQYGWRWLDNGPARLYTLPTAIFEALPLCPFFADDPRARNFLDYRERRLRQGKINYAPRWHTQQEAQAALSEGCLTWAYRVSSGT